jgi:hypothetical protein
MRSGLFGRQKSTFQRCAAARLLVPARRLVAERLEDRNLLAVLFEHGANAPVQVLVPVETDYDDLGFDWTGLAEPFDDSSWTTVTGTPNGVGYDRGSGAYDSAIGLDVESTMYEDSTTLFARAEFDVADATAVGKLTLRLRYDDGFIAWLNGAEVARANVTVSYPAWDARATSEYEAPSTPAEFDLSAHVAQLRSGENVLAIRLLNDSPTGDDALLQFTLTGESREGPPLAVDDTSETLEGQPVTIDVLANDREGSATINPSSVAISTPPTHGVAVANSDGTITYTPNPIYNGPDSFTYTVRDNSAAGQTTQQTLVASDAPVRVLVPLDDDIGTTWRGANDSFNDSSWTPGTFGVGYDDNPSGTDFWPYINLSVRSQMLNVNTSVYMRSQFEVADPLDVVALTLRMRYDDGFAAFLNGVRIAGDFDPEVLTYNSAAPGANRNDTASATFRDFDITAFRHALRPGTNVLAIHGLNIVLLSSDLLIQPELVAIVSDLGVDSNPATVSVNVTGVDYPPIARDDVYEVAENQVLLADADGSGTTSQQLVVPAGATWKYRDTGVLPSNDALGNDWKQAAFDDAEWTSGPAQLGYGDGDEATVVSFGPSSTNKHITTWFRHHFSLGTATITRAESLFVELLRDDAAAVYLNGIEIVRDNLPGILGDNSIGPSTLAPAFTTSETSFFPHSVDLSLPRYQDLLRDGENVLAVEVHQDGPGSSDISFDLRLSVVMPVVRGVLANDTEPDGQAMRVVLETPPQNGTLDLGGDGAFEYVPNVGFYGVETFTYRASDGELVSEPATVTITVRHLRPTANNDAYEIDEDTVLTVPIAQGLLANDTDTQNHPLTALLSTSATNGNVTLASDGSFVYEPRPHFVGVDSFTYIATDGDVDSVPAKVTIVVNPVAVNDVYSTAPGVAFSPPAVISGMFWAESGVGIYRAHVAGGDDVLITSDFSWYTAVDQTAEKLYWTTNDSSASIYRSNLDGSEVELLITDASGSFNGIALDVSRGKMYWANSNKIQRANLDGTEVETFLSSLSPQPRGLAWNAANEILYWTAGGAVGRYFAGIQTLAETGGDAVYEVELDVAGNKMYWAANDGIRRANLDGSNVEHIVPDSASGSGMFGLDLDLDGGKIYFSWFFSTGSEIRRANFDGSQVETLRDGLRSPRGIALLIDPASVLANDGNPAGELTALLVAGPTNGAIEFNPNGWFRYTPNAGFVGVDQFTYRAADGQSFSEIASVRIVVAPPGKAPQDLNADGAVDTADVAFLIASYGKSSAAQPVEGDLDGDGRIGVRDAIALRNAFTPPPSAAASVAMAKDRAIELAPAESELMRADRRLRRPSNSVFRIASIATDHALAASFDEPSSLTGRRSRLLVRTRG